MYGEAHHCIRWRCGACHGDLAMKITKVVGHFSISIKETYDIAWCCGSKLDELTAM